MLCVNGLETGPEFAGAVSGRFGAGGCGGAVVEDLAFSPGVSTEFVGMLSAKSAQSFFDFERAVSSTAGVAVFEAGVAAFAGAFS
jgi:hypothetical protein